MTLRSSFENDEWKKYMVDMKIQNNDVEHIRSILITIDQNMIDSKLKHK